MTMRATFAGLKREIPEGRQWVVHSDTSGNTYTVTFYRHTDGLRYGYCSCAAASFGQMCKHLVYAAKCDSILTGVPMRDVSELKKAA